MKTSPYQVPPPVQTVLAWLPWDCTGSADRYCPNAGTKQPRPDGLTVILDGRYGGTASAEVDADLGRYAAAGWSVDSRAGVSG